MQLRFTKMHGLGNDFVVIDLLSQNAELSADHIRHIADRHLGRATHHHRYRFSLPYL